MSIEFYNVKKKLSVKISPDKIKKMKYTRKTASGESVRYALKAVDDDGTKLTKFCSKTDFDKFK